MFSNISEEEVRFADLVDVCTVGPVSDNFEFKSDIGGADGESILPKKSGEESRITSVSKKSLLVTRFIGSRIYTFFS